jgi:hypothetical protein
MKIGKFVTKKQGVLKAQPASFGHAVPRAHSGSRQARSLSRSDLKRGSSMTAIVHALSRAFHSAKDIAKDIDCLKQIALFCGAGLLVSLLLLTYGVDLSPAFF